MTRMFSRTKSECALNVVTVKANVNVRAQHFSIVCDIISTKSGVSWRVSTNLTNDEQSEHGKPSKMLRSYVFRGTST